jgi:hypothetical protein
MNQSHSTIKNLKRMFGILVDRVHVFLQRTQWEEVSNGPSCYNQGIIKI